MNTKSKIPGASQEWKAVRGAMLPMKAGDCREINGHQVKRLSVQKWEVDGRIYAIAFDATEAIRAEADGLSDHVRNLVIELNDEEDPT